MQVTNKMLQRAVKEIGRELAKGSNRKAAIEKGLATAFGARSYNALLAVATGSEPGADEATESALNDDLLYGLCDAYGIRIVQAEEPEIQGEWNWLGDTNVSDRSFSDARECALDALVRLGVMHNGQLLASPALLELFRAEIRNEEHGGDSPATLQSAKDSMIQMPADVFLTLNSDLTALAADYERELHLLRLLCHTYGGTTTLAEMLARQCVTNGNGPRLNQPLTPPSATSAHNAPIGSDSWKILAYLAYYGGLGGHTEVAIEDVMFTYDLSDEEWDRACTPLQTSALVFTTAEQKVGLTTAGTAVARETANQRHLAYGLDTLLEKLGFDASNLDEMVYDAVDRCGSETPASDINNGGMTAQITYLLNCGFKPHEIRWEL